MGQAATPPPGYSRLRPRLAVAVVYACAIGGVWAIAYLYEVAQPQITGFLLMRLLLLTTAVGGLLVLGSAHFPAVFGGLPPGIWLVIGPLTGALGCGVSMLWVELVPPPRAIAMAYVPAEITWWTVLISPLLVAYTEEVVFRGVLWAALDRLEHAPWRIMVQTSVFFALLHLINGNGLWELPHRFLGGLLLGWLRWRSGNLLPSVQAHFVWLQVANLT